MSEFNLSAKKFILLGFACLPAFTQAAIHPPGGQIGTTVEAEIIGENEIWPPTFWCSEDGLKIEALEKKGKIKVTIPKEAQTGPVLIRTINKKAVSAAHIFVISNQKEIQETEPNNHLNEAQEIKEIPIVLNGRLQKSGDTDFYHINLEKDQTIFAKLDAYSLFSPIDSFIHILDSKGYEQAVSSDTLNLDPHLKYKAKETGRHTLQIIAIPSKASTSIQYAGSEESVYRLQLSLEENLPSPPLASIIEGDAPQILPIPFTLAGTFQEPNEVDTYKFEAKKGEQVLITVEAYSLQYPTDPVIKVCYNDGKLIKEVDDSTRDKPDAEYQLRAPKDDVYQIHIQDRFGHFGNQYQYRLNVGKPTPSFQPVIDKDLLTGTHGKEVSIKITLNRKNGHKEALYAMIHGLPNDVFFKGVDIAESAKDATITLSIPEKAKPGNYKCRIMLLDKAVPPKTFQQANFSFQTSTSRGDYLINDTPYFWLTIPEKEKPEEKEEKPKK